jgi:hypothetical protein
MFMFMCCVLGFVLFVVYIYCRSLLRVTCLLCLASAPTSNSNPRERYY